MKATPRLCAQIYGAQIGQTDRGREEVEGGRDRSGSQGHEFGEKQKCGRRRGYLVRGRRQICG